MSAQPINTQSDFDPSRVFVAHVGALLDHPSLFMGGPSRQSRAKAQEILNWLRTPEGESALKHANGDAA